MNEKTFSYNPLQYLFNVTLTGIFCGAVVLGCIYLIVFSSISPVLLSVIALVALYTMWNCFISKSNSASVTVSDDVISFTSFGRTDTYIINDIDTIRIREFPTGGKMYIRINDYGLRKGRYWIHFSKFEDGKTLMKKLLDIEYAIHPDSLKARARTVNTNFMKLKKSCK